MRVVLLNDGYKSSRQTIDALRGISKGGRAKGLSFSVIDKNAHSFPVL